jgi:phage-related minor tail protein
MGLDKQGFDTGLDKIMGLSPGAIAGIAGIGAAAVGVVAAVDKFGGEFAGAYDSIRAGTGATGAALDGLKDDFKEVVKDVPTDFGSAGDAIAEVNTRLGLTGEPLQEMTGQFLELSRITGGDVKTSIASATRVFGDWDVAADKQGGTMDALFRATQVSGVGFDALSDKLVRFGAPLRQMGFGLNESAAMMAKWEKEGVNGDLVLGSLRIAMGKFAKAGKDMPTGLKDTIAEIERLGPGAEATTLAMETFGARAGPDMAAAILEGRFAYEDYLDAIENGDDSINAVAEDTRHWRDSLTMLKNNILVGLEPALMGLFDGLGWVAGGLVKVAQSATLAAVFGAIGEAARWLGDAVRTYIGPVAGIVGGVGGEVGKTAAAWLAAFRSIASFLAGVWSALWAVFGPVVKAALGYVSAVVKMYLDVILNIVKAVLALLRGDWSAAWGYLKAAVKAALRGAWEATKAGVRLLVEVVKTIPRLVRGAVSGFGRLLWDAGSRLISGLIDGVKAKLGDLKDTLGGVAKSVVSWKGPPSKDAVLLRPAGRLLMDGLMGGIGDRMNALHSTLSAVTAAAGSVPVPAFAGAPGAAGGASGEIHEHYHLHFPGGTAVVGMAEDVGRTVAPAVGRQSAEAEAQRARRR